MHVITDSVPRTPLPGVMVDLIDSLLEVAPTQARGPVATPSAVPDQRRPGRLEQVSPALIPLPCEPAQCADTDQDIDTDPLVPARGIIVGLLLSVPLWALIGLGIWGRP
jgi:hypothetical protein